MTHTFSFSIYFITKRIMFHNNAYRYVRWTFAKKYIVIMLTLAIITINKDYVFDEVKEKNLTKKHEIWWTKKLRVSYKFYTYPSLRTRYIVCICTSRASKCARVLLISHTGMRCLISRITLNTTCCIRCWKIRWFYITVVCCW